MVRRDPAVLLVLVFPAAMVGVLAVAIWMTLRRVPVR
jgi:hypothetical protein